LRLLWALIVVLMAMGLVTGAGLRSGAWARPGQSPLRQTVPTPGLIIGVVFNDLDGDGLQDLGEEGLAGVQISLGGFRTTTTMANGLYMFDYVWPDAYLMMETDPAGYASTTANREPVFVPVDGGAVANFGDLPAGTVSGRVFNDLDGNGEQGVGEAGLGGVRVELRTLWGKPVRATTTDPLGTYVFQGVAPGTYRVAEQDPPGFVSTTAHELTVFVAQGGAATANFGDLPAGTVSGRVFNDLDGNGEQTPGEPGLAGVMLQLMGGGLLWNTTTTADGLYFFTGVPAGDYQVVETDPSGFVSTTPNTVTISLPAGDSATVNFGDLAAGVISGKVFLDRDGDGKPEAGERGLGGVLLFMDGVLSTTTDFEGFFAFTGVGAGEHSVQEIDPVRFTSVTANVVTVTVPAGGSAALLFGDLLGGTIGGVAFEDLDEDGVQDPGERGLGGVNIELRDENGDLLEQTTTAGNGTYLFANVSAGSYRVREEVPTGFMATTPISVSLSLSQGEAAVVNFGHRLTGFFRLYMPFVSRNR